MTESLTSDHPKVLFDKLYQKSIRLGLKQEDFTQLEGLTAIKKAREAKHYSNICYFLLKVSFGLIFCALFVFISEWPVSNTHLLVWWFQRYNLDPLEEPCVAYVPESLVDSLSPPIDCGFCRGVHQIDHVDNLDKQHFEMKYAYSGRPVVITDGTKNWTASKVFSYRFMKSVFSPGSDALSKVEKDCQFFPYKTNFTSLGQVFDMSEERALMRGETKPWYIGWSNCDVSAANILRQHYNRPYFLPEYSESSKTDWIFMGSPGYGAHMHIDNVEHPSWQAQIRGRKLWTLQPPYHCYFQCPAQLKVVVNEGEIIVLDTNRWYHSTLNVGDNISITIGSEFD